MHPLVKTLVANIASSLGYTIVPNWRAARISNVVFLQKLFEYLEINCVLDVGANKGQFRDFMRNEVGYRNLIVSFEPIPEHAALLRERARKDDLWLIYECALGKSNGHAAFNVMAETEFSSFLQPDHTVVSRFEQKNLVSRSVSVEVKTLDSVVADLERDVGSRNIYLKMDTQGYDLEVMAGGAEALGRVRSLQTEASIKPIYSGMPDYGRSIQTFQALGFEVSGVFPVSPENFPLLVEFDCVFTHKSWIANL